jgi:hypothetical protein
MIFGRWIDWEKKMMRFKGLVQRSKDKPGLNADPTCIQIRFENPVHIFRKIEEKTFSHFIARAACSSTPRGNGDSMLAGIVNDVDDILSMCWLYNPKRPDPI